MPISLPRRLAPSALALLTLLAASSAHASTPAPAPALIPVTAVDPANASCNTVSASLAHWTPAAGPPARFIADAFARGGGDGGLWIGLGYTDAGFWSAEGGATNDACDSCGELHVVLTGFDGKRRSFPVITSADQHGISRTTPDALKTLALTRLWHVAGTDWPVAVLKQDYKLKMAPNLDADGTMDPYPGWMAETSVRGKGLLRFAFRVERQVMCWCQFGWRGWNLAAPKKP